MSIPEEDVTEMVILYFEVHSDAHSGVSDGRDRLVMGGGQRVQDVHRSQGVFFLL